MPQRPDAAAARQALDAYGSQPQPWPHWVFDRLEIAPGSRALELGCGVGLLWRDNSHRPPPAKAVVLCDFRAGYLQAARDGLGDGLFRYCNGDAHALPFADGVFDTVIANHMLYLLADRPAALAEIRRVLRPGGRFYAATNPDDLMLPGWQLADEACGRPIRPTRPYAFGVEDGAAQLAPFFADIGLEVYENMLAVTEPEPTVAYVHSLEELTEEQLARLRRLVADRLARDGKIDFKKAHGLFRCRREN